MKPTATVCGKPLCDSCLTAEHDLTELKFDVTFLDIDTEDGLVWLAERGYPMDGSLTLPVIEIHGWPTKAG